MDSSGKDTNDFAGKGQAATDKAADRLQTGISNVKQGANSVANSASENIEKLRNKAGDALNNASEKGQGILDQGMDAVRKVQDFAADTQDSIVTYTRQKPVKALLIAAAAGAVVVTLIRALSPSSRDT